MAGWRVGFMVGNPQIIQGLRSLKTNLDYGIFAALQAAGETALQLPDTYLHQGQDRYRRRGEFLIKGLADLGWDIPPTKASMYLWMPCPHGMGSTDFAMTLLQQTGVVVTPGNAFGIGGEGYVRISLIAECDRLQEALCRLKQANIHY